MKIFNVLINQIKVAINLNSVRIIQINVAIISSPFEINMNSIGKALQIGGLSVCSIDIPLNIDRGAPLSRNGSRKYGMPRGM